MRGNLEVNIVSLSTMGMRRLIGPPSLYFHLTVHVFTDAYVRMHMYVSTYVHVYADVHTYMYIYVCTQTACRSRFQAVDSEKHTSIRSRCIQIIESIANKVRVNNTGTCARRLRINSKSDRSAKLSSRFMYTCTSTTHALPSRSSFVYCKVATMSVCANSSKPTACVRI